MGWPTEDINGEGSDVEHHHGHEEVVPGAEDLTGHRQPRRLAQVLRDLCLWRQLINYLEQPLRLDQLGQADDPAALQHTEYVPEMKYVEINNTTHSYSPQSHRYDGVME